VRGHSGERTEPARTDPAVRALLERYLVAVDRGRPEEAAACFTPDGTLRIEDEVPLEGRVAIAAALRRLERYEATAHVLAASDLELEGDHGRGESWCRAHHVYEDGGSRRDRVLALRYVDRYLRVDGAWAIEARHLQVDWVEDRPLEVR
jgi:hypothetical protein